MTARKSVSARRRLWPAGVLGLALLMLGGGGCATTPPPGMVWDVKKPKLIVVLFGGGTRSSESIGDAEHRYIPHLWKELVPRGTLFTNMRVEGKVVHPNSAGSVLTGHWEWDDIDWTRPVVHPTIFEVFRRARGAPDTKAWAFVYASILAKAGESSAPGFGPPFGPNVMVPPTIPRATSEAMDERLRKAALNGSKNEALTAAWDCGRLARTESRLSFDGLKSRAARRFVDDYYEQWKKGGDTSSHDAFIAEAAIQSMTRFAPEVIFVAFGEIDCAHYGSWSRYVEAIQRTDALTARLWSESQRLPAYRNQTLMLILPDHGRELEESGGLGFVHHSDFYTGQGTDEGCRRVWMLAIGKDVAEGRVIHKPLPITSVAATGLEYLGLKASDGAAGSVLWLARQEDARWSSWY
jgi:hypothetical protein